MHKFAERFDLAQDAGGRISVSNCDDLVLLLFQSLFHFVQLWSITNWRFKLGCLNAIRLEAVCEGVGKVACVQNESFIARFH